MERGSDTLPSRLVYGGEILFRIGRWLIASYKRIDTATVNRLLKSEILSREANYLELGIAKAWVVLE